MISCKKHFIAACFTLMVPLTCWSEAPVVDDSENFAMMEGQQAPEAPVANSKYGDPQIENSQIDNPKNESYANDTQDYDGPALVKDDQSNNPSTNDIKSNVQLIDKVQNLQQAIQELRGQLEVQAHDLKLLQQQQVAFYKDLDARLGSSSAKSTLTKPTTDISMGTAAITTVTDKTPAKLVNTTTLKPQPIIPVSRANPADEQISYLAAYELVKSKQYDNALNAMQTFIRKYPQGGYSANAQYWLGELYMVKRDYPNAIAHFDVVLKQFPSSSKSAASMLKAGYAHAATGNNDEAKRRLQQVVKTYPDTPTAQLAHSKLEAINAI